MKLTGAILTLLGVCVLGVGLVLGLGSVHRDGVGCGSGFGGLSSNAEQADFRNAFQADASGQTIPDSQLSSVQNACSSAVSDRKTLALAASVPGGALIVAGLVALVVAANREDDEPAYTAPADGSTLY